MKLNRMVTHLGSLRLWTAFAWSSEEKLSPAPYNDRVEKLGHTSWYSKQLWRGVFVEDWIDSDFQFTFDAAGTPVEWISW